MTRADEDTTGGGDGSATRSFAQTAMEWEPLVRIYESRLWRRNPLFALATGIGFEREFELIARACRLGPGARVLDLACGSGIYARRLARRVESGPSDRSVPAPRSAPAVGGFVVGVDLSAPMLRHAQRSRRSEGLRHLHLARGDATRLPLASGSCDAVTCCGALHLFPDADAALREVHRVLAPGGRFATAVFRRGDRALSERAAALRRRILGVDAYTPAELSSRLAASGLADAECLHTGGVWMLMSARKPAARTGEKG